MDRISILVVDDQLLFCESLRTVLQEEMHDAEVIGMAHNGNEALALIAKTNPDVVLMDVRMPMMDGVQATRIIQERYPRTKVIMLTTYEDDEYVRDALKHGALGYLLKDTPLDRLIWAIRAVNEGLVMVSPSVVQRLLVEPALETLEGHSSGFAASPPEWLNQLSRREKEILVLIAKGFNNTEIADQLFVAAQTVKNHLSEIYDKVGIHDRAKLSLLVSRFPKRLLR